MIHRKDEQDCPTHNLNINGEEVEEIRPVNVFTGVDPDQVLRKELDYSVIFNIAIDSDNNRWVFPYFRKREGLRFSRCYHT